MFAFFGLGLQEMVILLLIGLLLIGGPIVAVVVALFLTRRLEDTGDPPQWRNTVRRWRIYGRKWED